MKTMLVALTAALLPLMALADEKDAAAKAAVPSIKLDDRQANATPQRQGFTHTGPGNIDVQQPSPDTLVLTMTGVAVAGAHPCKASLASLMFDVVQCFEVAFDKPGANKARLTVETRLIGVLRSHKCGDGSAEVLPGCVTVTCGPAELVSLLTRAHTVAGGENLSINDHPTPASVTIAAGKYTLHQTLGISAHHPRKIIPFKACSAEFAPDPALDPLWISYFEPFRGAQKKDFGFQVTLKVAAE